MIVNEPKDIPRDLIPKKVYKYRLWDDQEPSINRIITDREIRFTSPSGLLADYPECQLPFRYDLITEEDLQKKSVQLAKIQYPNIKGNRKARYIQEIRKNMKYDDRAFREKVERDFKDYMDKVLGVFCTSLKFDDIKIWETLGVLGQGYCVELITDELLKLPAFSGGIGYVNYYKYSDIPVIKPIHHTSRERIEDAMTRIINVPIKYSYEQEFRFTKLNSVTKNGRPVPYKENERIVSLPIEAYSSVKLGYDISEYDKNAIIRSARESLGDTPIFQTKIENGKIVESMVNK